MSRRKPDTRVAAGQRSYYRSLLETHGDSPRSVGYNDATTQNERFARLARVFDGQLPPFTVHEIGCGLGHFGEYLAAHHPGAAYSGSDLVEEFVLACRKKLPGSVFELRDVTAEPPAERYDFVTMSGTLNPRLETPDAEWSAHVRAVLDAMYRMARCGIAANFLTSYGHEEKRRPELHYQDPAEILDHITRRLSRHVEIDAAGPLYEFTLRVHRPEHVRALYPAAEFNRYFG